MRGDNTGDPDVCAITRAHVQWQDSQTEADNSKPENWNRKRRISSDAIQRHINLVTTYFKWQWLNVQTSNIISRYQIILRHISSTMVKPASVDDIVAKIPTKILPPIPGEPDYDWISQLNQLMYGNADTLPTTLVGRAHRHVGLIMNATL